MPDKPLDKLEIQITSSSEGAEKKVNALADALERLSNMSSLKGIEGVAKKITALGDASQKIAVTVDTSSDKALDGIIDKVGVLQRAIEKVNATAIKIPSLSNQTGAKSTSSTQIVQADASISEFSEVAESKAEKVDDKVSALNNVKKAAEDAASSVKKIRKSLSDQWSTWSSLGGMVHGVTEKIKNTAASSDKFVKVLRGAIPVVGVISTVLGGVWTVGGKIFSVFKNVASTIAGGVVGGVKKLASALKSIGSHVLNYVTKPFTRAISVIQNWMKKLLNVAFYRTVRTAIKMVTDGFKEGIENLYYFSSLVGTQFAPAMDRLATSSLYLKNSLGAMVGPLIQSVAPVVDFLVDKFVQLLNAINMVFAALGGGGTYTKAIKNAAKYGDDLDQSMGGAAKSAKEFKRYLIGIDELNVIPEQSSPSGGGGSGSGLDEDYGKMFEQAPLPNWVKSIKDAIADGDWKGAGEMLADKVNTSLIEPLKQNAAKWGNTIGQTIQHGIELAVSFVRNLDIEGVGSSVATIIGNALNNIQPADLGAILASGIKSAFRFAHGLLQGYTGPEIGTYLSGVVNGWFAELRRDGGWAKAGQDLNKAILSIINGVTSFISGLDTNGIANDLRTFFGKIDWAGIWRSMKTLAQVAAEKIPWQDMLNSLWRFAGNALVFLRREVLGIPSNQASRPWQDLEGKLSRANETINWADIISGLIAFVGDITSTIKAALPANGWKGIWTRVKDSLSKALGFNSWEDLKSQFKDKVFNVISSAFDLAIDYVYEWLTNKGGWVGEATANLFMPDHYQVGHAFENLNNALKNGYAETAQNQINAMVKNGDITASEAARIAAENGYSYANGLLTALPDIEGNAWTISDTVTGALDEMSTGGYNAAKNLRNRMNPELDHTRRDILDNLGTAASDTITNFGDMESSVVSDAASMQSGSNGSWESIASMATQKVMAIRTMVTSNWDLMKNKVETTNSNISSNVSSTFETIKSTASAGFSTLRGTVQANMDAIKSTATTALNNISNNASSSMQQIISSMSSGFSTIRGTVQANMNAVKSTVSTAMSNISSSASNAARNIQNSVGNSLNYLANNAWNWGHDIAVQLANGMNQNARYVTNAASSLASTISSYLHFSVPDKGPLSDFDTYMPDMMKEIASGIRQNSGIALSAVSSFAGSMADQIGFASSPRGLSYDFSSELSYAVDGPDASAYGSSYYAGGDMDNSDIINAVNAIGAKMIAAINELSKRPIAMDGRKVSEETTSQQNRMNMMYGRTLQNV